MVKHNQTENFMSLSSRLMISAMMVLFIFAWSGCCCPNKPIEKANTNKAKETGKADSSVATKEQKMTNGMKIAFAHPVVMVNGKRTENNDAQKTIEVAYPTNTNSDITVVVLDPEGNEQTLQGQIKTFEHTEHTTPDVVILVVPDDPETTYYDIIRNGYGEISVCEYIQRADSVEEKGKVLFQIVLGSKKKKSSIHD